MSLKRGASAEPDDANKRARPDVDDAVKALLEQLGNSNAASVATSFINALVDFANISRTFDEQVKADREYTNASANETDPQKEAEWLAKKRDLREAFKATRKAKPAKQANTCTQLLTLAAELAQQLGGPRPVVNGAHPPTSAHAIPQELSDDMKRLIDQQAKAAVEEHAKASYNNTKHWLETHDADFTSKTVELKATFKSELIAYKKEHSVAEDMREELERVTRQAKEAEENYARLDKKLSEYIQNAARPSVAPIAPPVVARAATPRSASGGTPAPQTAQARLAAVEQQVAEMKKKLEAAPKVEPASPVLPAVDYTDRLAAIDRELANVKTEVDDFASAAKQFQTKSAERAAALADAFVTKAEHAKSLENLAPKANGAPDQKALEGVQAVTTEAERLKTVTEDLEKRIKAVEEVKADREALENRFKAVEGVKADGEALEKRVKTLEDGVPDRERLVAQATKAATDAASAEGRANEASRNVAKRLDSVATAQADNFEALKKAATEHFVALEKSLSAAKETAEAAAQKRFGDSLKSFEDSFDKLDKNAQKALHDAQTAVATELDKMKQPVDKALGAAPNATGGPPVWDQLFNLREGHTKLAQRVDGIDGKLQLTLKQHAEAKPHLDAMTNFLASMFTAAKSSPNAGPAAGPGPGQRQAAPALKTFPPRPPTASSSNGIAPTFRPSASQPPPPASLVRSASGSGLATSMPLQQQGVRIQPVLRLHDPAAKSAQSQSGTSSQRPPAPNAMGAPGPAKATYERPNGAPQ